MGCGGSKGDPQRESVASMLPPLLRRRLDEIKRRRNESSGKQLLKKDCSREDDHSFSLCRHHSAAAVRDHINNDRRSLASAPLIAKVSSPEGKADNVENKNHHEERDHKEGENGEESDEEGRLNNFEISYLCPNSPSFRVYCTNEPENAKDDTDNKDDDYEQKTQGHDIAACVDSNEESMTMAKTKDKRKKGRRLKKPVAVKNLLNVKSCYYPRSRRDSSPLLAPNSAA